MDLEIAPPRKGVGNCPEFVSHTGILVSATADTLDTFEFNTTSPAHKEGGAISYKTRAYDKTVKGFVVLTTRSIHQFPDAK